MIYIIDDDKYVRRGFEILFKSAGMDCTSYGSAEEFLEVIHLVVNDIIILDMHMPGMNGCELLNHLAGLELFLPVIVITAYDEAASRECAKKYGALAYLRKPVDSEALIDLIKYNMNPV
jgi:two-component system nitrogen regulation response regulator GlnG